MNSSATGGPDRLTIRNLELQCVIGAEDWERLMPQRVIVDIELRGDFSAAADSDDLVDAVDYRTACIKAAEVAASDKFRLVETLADQIARANLAVYPGITSAIVAVHKPLALAGFGRAEVVVEVTRDLGPGYQEAR